MKRSWSLATFDSEADLCDSFIAHARVEGWKIYPETSGFDLIIVRDLIMVGIEAKLRFNIALMHQLVSHLPSPPHYCWTRDVGPDFVAALVPDRRDTSIAGALGVVHIAPTGYSYDKLTVSWPRLDSVLFDPRLKLSFPKRCWLPPVEPGGRAGCPAPVSLTRWKVGALKVCALLRSRGWVTSKDIIECGNDPGRWRVQWLEADGMIGRLQRLVPRPGVPLPDDAMPEAAALFRAMDSQ